MVSGRPSARTRRWRRPSPPTPRSDRTGRPAILGQPARQLDADDALAEAQHLGVVRQHRAFDGEAVVGGHGADPGHLVGADGHAETGAADQQRAVGVTVGDQRRGRHRDVRVGGVSSSVADADIDHRGDPRGRPRRSRLAGRSCTPRRRRRRRRRSADRGHWRHSPPCVSSGWFPSGVTSAGGPHAQRETSPRRPGCRRCARRAAGRGPPWASARRWPRLPRRHRRRPAHASAARHRPRRSCRGGRRTESVRRPSSCRRLGLAERGDGIEPVAHRGGHVGCG